MKKLLTLLVLGASITPALSLQTAVDVATGVASTVSNTASTVYSYVAPAEKLTPIPSVVKYIETCETGRNYPVVDENTFVKNPKFDKSIPLKGLAVNYEEFIDQEIDLAHQNGAQRIRFKIKKFNLSHELDGVETIKGNYIYFGVGLFVTYLALNYLYPVCILGAGGAAYYVYKTNSGKITPPNSVGEAVHLTGLNTKLSEVLKNPSVKSSETPPVNLLPTYDPVTHYFSYKGSFPNGLIPGQRLRFEMVLEPVGTIG